MRIAHTLAGLMLVGATACGGDGSDAPGDASEEDFCEAVEAAPNDGKPSQDDVDEWVDKLKDAGTPDDISDDERNGFEVLVEALDDADVDDIDENSSFEDVVEDEGDRADVTKFFTYYAETCVDVSTEVPSGLPSEFPTDLLSDPPSDLTELPSDFPTDIES